MRCSWTIAIRFTRLLYVYASSSVATKTRYVDLSQILQDLDAQMPVEEKIFGRVALISGNDRWLDKPDLSNRSGDLGKPPERNGPGSDNVCIGKALLFFNCGKIFARLLRDNRDTQSFSFKIRTPAGGTESHSDIAYWLWDSLWSSSAITTPPAKTEASCRIMFCMSSSRDLDNSCFTKRSLCAAENIAAAEGRQPGSFYADQFRMSCKNHSVGISRPRPARRAAS
jgi:hypothetical protein